MVQHKYNSLEDYLISQTLTVDAQIDDGWGVYFPVRGCEIDATILFADMTSFSARTKDLSPTETLIFINNFFAWISAEALIGGHGIIDKYIGDEVMIVFSKEFGSDDPFVDAIQTARFMAERDALGFCPHMGIASGVVTVGYVGTPLKYNCSVFGSPVALAARCANVKPLLADNQYIRSQIVFPYVEWQGRDFDSVFPPRKYKKPDGSIHEQDHSWELLPARTIGLKNIGDTEIREIINRSIYLPQQSAEDRAKQALQYIIQAGRYWSKQKTK